MDGSILLQIALGYSVYILYLVGSLTYQEIKKEKRMREYYKKHPCSDATLEPTEAERELARVEIEYAELLNEQIGRRKE